ncbi:hypothetical protein MPH47_02280 [Psychrobacillus psychrodurans]|uniref:hypothetical protein n=2 Tax=Bacillaceae TaxID=186817 RepID=UPI001F4D82D0|nr:hypothetical protein [Psychrobacillus psychrodurans]MCK1996066.1 hypothetical protein [Psychrobacillus psychrodurans]
MKNYLPGFIISLILFIILAIVNQQVYSNVMSLDLLIPLLVLQVTFYKFFIVDKKRLPYFILICIFLITVLFSLPELTHNQAKEKVINKYEMNILKTDTIPIENDNIWNPFNPNRAYFFKGYSSNSNKEVSVMVIPNNGMIVVINQ